MNKNDICPAHMQDIFNFAKDAFISCYSYLSEKDYDNMVTDYFKTHYTKEEMDQDLPLEECCPAVQRAYDFIPPPPPDPRTEVFVAALSRREAQSVANWIFREISTESDGNQYCLISFDDIDEEFEIKANRGDIVLVASLLSEMYPHAFADVYVDDDGINAKINKEYAEG